MRMITSVVVGCIGLSAVRAGDPPSDAERYWPQWRGPLATGVAPHGDPPVEWSESKNVRWKIDLPGEGHATPIVWGDRVYLLTAIKTGKRVESPTAEERPRPDRPREGRRGRRGGGRRGFGRSKPTDIYRFAVLALDRKTGKVVWERTVREELPHEAGHQTGSQASCSPVTDGKHLYAHFGSRGLFCLDMDGNVKWEKDFGDMRTRNGFGEGTSPALYGDTVVLTWDHEGDSFIVALDKNTGKQRWRTARDERTSWATPLVLENNGKPQVVTSATSLIRGYDLATGDLIWKCGGMTANVIPSPVAGNDLLYALSGYRGNALLAIRYGGAQGDITGTKTIAWEHDRGTPYVPSPLLYEDTLYFLQSNRAVLSCFDAKTGKEHYGQERIEGMRGVYASPVGAAGRVYVAGQDGKTLVVERGPEFKILARNALDDGFDASPAIVDQEIYLRGREHLYCIARE